MTPTDSHPSHDDWIRWVEARPGDDRSSLTKHLETCEHCRNIVQVLRELKSAQQARRWESPPDSAAESAAERPKESAALPLPEAESVEWQESGVRSPEGSLAAAGEARLASRVFDDGEVGILAIPPHGDGRWVIRGKVWLRHDTGSIQISLVDGEHVVATTTVQSGADFVIEEVVDEGWHLEIRLPGGGGFTLKEPGS